MQQSRTKLITIAARYAFLSLVGYATLYSCHIAFVELLGWNPRYSFVLAYSIAYVVDYILNVRVLFVTETSWDNFIRYIIYISTFLLITSVTNSILISLDAHYLAASIISVVIYLPLRVWALRKFVYRTPFR